MKLIIDFNDAVSLSRDEAADLIRQVADNYGTGSDGESLHGTGGLEHFNLGSWTATDDSV